MIAFLCLFVHVLLSPFKTQARLEAGIVILRHQLNVLRRRALSRPKLTVADRLLFVWLYRLFPSALSAITIIQPETVIRWHRAGFRPYWRWKSRSRGGRLRIPEEIHHLIQDMSLANPLWGVPRINAELLRSCRIPTRTNPPSRHTPSCRPPTNASASRSAARDRRHAETRARDERD